MNTFNLNLDLDKTSGIIQWVTLRQGDKNGTQLSATIYDHGTPVTGSYTARFSLRHPGTGDTYYRETATYNNGVATVTVDEQYAATVTGITAGYFELLQGSTVIASTADFGVRILASATDGAVPGEVYDSAIEDALAELDEATGRINQMVVDATEEYLNAHPELTTTVEDNSLTDAKLIQQGGILSRVDRLMYRLDNLLTNTPAEAESVTVTDAAKTPVAGLALYGKSTQDGTPTPSAPVPIQSVAGNLIPFPYYGSSTSSNGITWTVNADGTITADGTATAGSYFVLHKRVTFGSLPAGTYTLSGSPFVTGALIRLQYTNASGTIQTPSSTGGASDTFTSDTEIEIPEGNYNLFCYIPSGTTVSNATFAPTLVEGGVAAGAYVPYGHVGLWTRGRNLWSLGQEYSRTSAGDLFARSTMHVPAGQYTLSFDVVSFTSGSNNNAQLLMYDQSVTVVTQPVVALRTGRVSLAVNPSRDVESLKIYVGTACTLANFQLEHGSTAHAYEPYTESVTAIPLDGHELRSLPDGTRDEVTVDERGHVTLVQRVGSYTVTGSEQYVGAASVGTCYRVALVALSAAPAVAGQRVYGYCTHAPYNSVSWTEDRVHVYADGNNVALFAVGSSVSDVLNAYKGAEITYHLATPVTHDLGTIDPVPLCGPDLTAQAVPTAPMQLTYERDLNATLARLESAIADVATS